MLKTLQPLPENYSIMRMVPCLLVMGTIFFLSHTPGEEIAALLPSETNDKLCHFLAYFVLAASFLWAFSPSWRQKFPFYAAILVVFFSFLYGCFDEFHQSFIVSRTADGADIIADSCGAICCSILWLFILSGKFGKKRR